MSNPVKGQVPLKLADGREFTLVADHAALVKAAQAHTGKTKLAKLMADIMPLLDEDGKVKLDEDGEPEKDTLPATCALFFGTLDAYHPDLALRDATNILFTDVDRVSAAVAEAIGLAFPDAKASTEGNVAAKPATPRGKNSGRSGAKQG